jgi:peroxiredoxin
MSDVIIREPPRGKRNLGVALLIVGLFLVGSVIVFYLTNAQRKIFDYSNLAIPPVTGSYPAPTLELTNLEGIAVSLADYKGKVILVNNWATWCPPCKDEMPELQAYFDDHHSDGFVVVAIEAGEPASKVAEFVRDLELTFPVWLDPHTDALEAFENWDLPSSYIIDRQGQVRLSWTGAINLATLEKYVTPLLEE